jgi:hypothetical protein
MNAISMRVPKSVAKVSKHDQFEHENQMWKRSLQFFKQENAALKTRLSEIIDGTDDKDFFKLAEYFQNLFLLKDELGQKLETEITSQLERLNLEPLTGYISTEIQNSQENLRREISYFESDFLRMKNEFNQLVLQSL